MDQEPNHIRYQWKDKKARCNEDSGIFRRSIRHEYKGYSEKELEKSKIIIFLWGPVNGNTHVKDNHAPIVEHCN